MNNNIDLPLESLKEPGNIWINEKTHQIRYSVNKDLPIEILQPLSIYQVGNDLDDATNPTNSFIKRGQPVSIGFIDELAANLQTSGDPCVVPTNPHTHQWCIGISLEPGNADRTDGSLDHVHVLSHGQIEYTLNDTRPNSYQPPNDGSKYLWDYNDIGKPVMVSNYPGEEGGLTIDITHAYFNGANILTVGRIADAPVPGVAGEEQRIIIEIQLAGDVRGMIDSTQFDVTLSDEIPLDDQGNEIVYTNSPDRLIFVKIIDDPNSNKSLGIMITNDEILLENGAVHSPLGCFLAKSDSNKNIFLKDYAGKTILLHRLGIIEANFQFPESDFGKDLYLSAGNITTTGVALSYEYKVGVVIESGRILVDCRYPRIFAKFEMIGKIKPAYVDRTTLGGSNTVIADPGYVVIDKDEIHKVSGTWAGDTSYPLIDFTELIKIVMYQGVILYCPPTSSGTPSGTFVEIDGNKTFNDIKDGFFKFRDIFYSLDGEVYGQIKFSNEGAPDNIQYVWPEMYFQEIIVPGPNSWRLDESPIRFNINYLYNLGAYIDGNGNNIEAYDIICKLPQEYDGRYLSPGFYTIIDDNNEVKWCGYEWAIQFNESLGNWELIMITNPGSSSPGPTYIPDNKCLGFCYPPGNVLSSGLTIEVVIRRRPTQYHNLFLNQLNAQNPWHPHTTGNDIVTGDTLYFGEMYSGIAINPNENFWQLDMRGANSISFHNYNKAGSIYKKILKYTVGPYYENALTKTNLVNQLLVQYQPVDLSGNLVSGYSINWTYDFDNNIAYLGAEFAPKLLSYPTKMDVSGVILEKFVEVYEDYIAGATSDNISGYYDTPRSALKTLHEVPTQFFNYTDDVDFYHHRIHTAQEAWNKSGNSIERWQPHDFVREIFPKSSSGFYHDGTTYIYESDTNPVVSSQKEWEHITEEINFLFNPILRNGDTILDGGDTTYIHTNLGLLNHAAKETQDRFLRLERSLFGADYEFLPNGKNISSNYSIFKQLQDTLHDGGIARETQFLYDQTLLNLSPSGYYSEYNTLMWEFYGNYTNKDEYVDNAIASGYQYNLDNHFHDVYIWYLENSDLKGKQYHVPFYALLAFNDIGVKLATYDARKVYFNKYYSGYYSETNNNTLPINYYPFAWPINNPNTSLENLDPEDRFFNSNMVGYSDEWSEIVMGSTVFHRTIDSTSLEGVIYDIIIKLSFIKNTTEDFYHQYMQEFVNLFPVNVMRGDNLLLKRDYKYLNDFVSLFNGVASPAKISSGGISNLSGYYSALGFISGKLFQSFGMSLINSNEPNNHTNLYREIGPNFHLRTKNVKDFETTKIINFERLDISRKAGSTLQFKNLETLEIYRWKNIKIPFLESFHIVTDLEDFDSATGGKETSVSVMPTGNYLSSEGFGSENISKIYFDSITETIWTIPELETLPFDDYQLMPYDIYHHFPSTASGKVPYAPKQYIQSHNIVQTTLGEFVMAHDNEFFHGESGHWYISGTSGHQAWGMLTYDKDDNTSLFNGISGYHIEDGESGYYFTIPGNNGYIDKTYEDYGYRLYREGTYNFTDPEVTYYLKATHKWWVSGFSGYRIQAERADDNDWWYISGISGYSISGYRYFETHLPGYGTLRTPNQDIYIKYEKPYEDLISAGYSGFLIRLFEVYGNIKGQDGYYDENNNNTWTPQGPTYYFGTGTIYENSPLPHNPNNQFNWNKINTSGLGPFLNFYKISTANQLSNSSTDYYSSNNSSYNKVNAEAFIPFDPKNLEPTLEDYKNVYYELSGYDFKYTGNTPPDYISGNVDTGITSRLYTYNSNEEIVHKNSIHYLDTPSHNFVDFIEWLSAQENSQKVKQGGFHITIDNDHVSGDFEAVLNISAFIPTVSGFSYVSGFLTQNVSGISDITDHFSYPEISGKINNHIDTINKVIYNEVDPINLDVKSNVLLYDISPDGKVSGNLLTDILTNRNLTLKDDTINGKTFGDILVSSGIYSSSINLSTTITDAPITFDQIDTTITIPSYDITVDGNTVNVPQKTVSISFTPTGKLTATLNTTSNINMPCDLKIPTNSLISISGINIKDFGFDAYDNNLTIEMSGHNIMKQGTSNISGGTEIYFNNSISGYIPRESLIIISGDTHNIPIFDNSGIDIYIPSFEDDKYNSDYHIFKISGFAGIQSNIILDKNATQGYLISGKTYDLWKLEKDINYNLDYLSGYIYITSGRILSRETTIEADLNEKPVTYKLSLTENPEWLNYSNNSTQFKILYTEYGGTYEAISSTTVKGFILSRTIIDQVVSLAEIEESVLKSLLFLQFNTVVELVRYNQISDNYFMASNSSTLPPSLISTIRQAGVSATMITDAMIIAAFQWNEYYRFEINGEATLVDKNSSDIISGNYSREIDTEEGGAIYISEDFPYYQKKFYSGYSLLISGEITYTTSGYMITGYDIANKPIDIEKNDISGLVSGIYDKYNVSSFRNSGIIYGIHLTDDVDMNIRLKRKEHIKGSLQLILDTKMFHPYNYTQDDLNELIINETPYNEGTIIEIIETEKFKNYPYTILSSYGKEDPNDSDFWIYNICGISFDHNFIIQTGDSADVDMYIIPGIINAKELRLGKAETIISRKVTVKKDTSKVSISLAISGMNIDDFAKYPIISTAG